jgi:hypothetical protein
MVSYLDLEDSESLRRKIDKKASDLFRVRKNKPQLQVTKCYRTIEEGKETICVERNQDVVNMSELKALHHVRELILLMHHIVQLVIKIVLNICCACDISITLWDFVDYYDAIMFNCAIS